MLLNAIAITITVLAIWLGVELMDRITAKINNRRRAKCQANHPAGYKNVKILGKNKSDGFKIYDWADEIDEGKTW